MRVQYLLVIVLVVGHLAGRFSSVSFADTACQPAVAKMASVQGTVEVRRAGQTQWEPARLNESYCPGDRIQVGARSRADLALANQPILRLDQNSILTLGGMKEEGTSVIELLRGVLHFFSRAPRRLEVNTAFVNAGVRGTEGVIQVEDDRTLITVFEGEVLAENSKGSLKLGDGQSALAEQDKAPVPRVVVRPRDAVQWALYYPPVIYAAPQDFEGEPSWLALVRDSIQAHRDADYRKAFEALSGVPNDIQEPRFFTYRASLLLGVGRADEAVADLDRALKLDPKLPDALALRSIIALVHGDKNAALALASEAVHADPNTGSGLLALSYAEQANFNLEGALGALERAVQANPNNALAWARLAELHLSFARLDQAVDAAQKAVALRPNLSRTQAVLGFAYLARTNTRAAKEAFSKSIEFDQSDSLPRLGLGLAKIREGNLLEGRKEIEIAASLDPNHSITRSYMGKAYFEEKRSELAERQYEIAKELDPKDPTPWFYDAIQKQTTNRPVEALRDLQKAIELNDNRAVYRSRLLLDADLAARGASLGHVYSDLGFEELALVEGWKSVNTDPSNFSAHRLLADSYSSLPRHEIARVSELLQSQLLQPVNLTPIQPRLAESNLFLISAGGPGAVAFNEFNQLFARNQLGLQASGLVGNHTDGAEAVVSGIFEKYAFGVGGFRFNSDGWRVNSDQHDSIGIAFLQVQPTPDVSAQFEYRYRETKTGDLNLRFFPDDAKTGLRTTANTNNYRVGLRYSFTPGSVLLVSLQYQDDERRSTDLSDPNASIAVVEPSSSAAGGELQHLFRSARFSVMSGAGYYKLNRHQDTNFDLGGFPIEQDELDVSVKHTNLYVYSYLSVLEGVTLTLGVSHDSYRSPRTLTDFLGGTVTGTPSSIDQFNPKFGVSWNPVPQTTLRTAVFRTLKRSLITNQTLEPTQVAGFNQFYDDIEGTDAWNYGVAVDQKFSEELFGGLVLSRRDLRILINDPTAASNLLRRDWREYLARPYLFWAFNDRLAATAEYRYERFERSADAFNFGLKTATTYQVPVGLRYFHPAGVSLGVKMTYIKQSGEFLHQSMCCDPGRTDFWLTDVGVSYRLPKRYGFVAVGAANIFDRRFQYQGTDFNNPTFLPGRSVFMRLTLALP